MSVLKRTLILFFLALAARCSPLRGAKGVRFGCNFARQTVSG